MFQYLILLSVNLFLFMQATTAQQTIPLYDGKIPNNKEGIKNTEYAETGDDRVERVFEVSEPTLTVYKPKIQDKRGISIVICPGGGYHILSIDKEGREIAHSLNEMGITAFVLKYRIPSNNKNVDKSVAPLMDAQRAVQLVREQAKRWGIDKNKIGIMGFSAGGHLAAAASTQYINVLIANTLQTSLRPDFSVLAYPVISFDEKLTHKGSRDNLLQDASLKNNKFYTSTEQAVTYFSAEKNITSQTPPAFIFHSQDDNVVNVANSLHYYQQLIENKVPGNQLIIYPSGGHGYGLNLPGKNEKWIERLKNWLDILYP